MVVVMVDVVRFNSVVISLIFILILFYYYLVIVDFGLDCFVGLLW